MFNGTRFDVIASFYIYDFYFEDLELVLRIDEHRDSVICAEFSVEGLLLATGDMSGLIVISSTADLRRCFAVSIAEYFLMSNN